MYKTQQNQTYPGNVATNTAHDAGNVDICKSKATKK